jgi:hypothetical protein
MLMPHKMVALEALSCGAIRTHVQPTTTAFLKRIAAHDLVVDLRQAGVDYL